ncbi:MAG: AraC family transcriptional regulator [Candidatus Cloacimonetes bacterium]|nr:AraC family transcriptional regulator [Candidatus Cloacimonadota bacterium]MCF7814880.1 AraC family transcriptional regulator [Candidatus Cloacimonadota bacterium]MCF7868155.1 AraC family transcriptional regulator [Candidatus Cloacimonadota bacterium]MCF7884571.1 AraC family transcriptional regulator [Candidatus Cloacimonadota bacterium]
MPDYQRALNSSVNFIENNLKSRFEMESVADRAGFSLYHFMRIFYGFTGYTLKGYIRERRLSEAARELLHSHKKVQELATEYGFESSESFIRAFKKEFRSTPEKFRKENQLIKYTPRLKVQICRITKGDMKMDWKIKDMPEIRVIGIKRKIVTRESKEQIAALWDEFLSHINKNENLRKLQTVGICFPEPKYLEQQPEPDDTWYYMAAVIADQNVEIPEALTEHKIPAAKYAVFTHKGSFEKLHETYKFISVDWIQQVDYEFYLHEEIEWYDDRFKPEDPENSEYDILVPIR